MLRILKLRGSQALPSSTVPAGREQHPHPPRAPHAPHAPHGPKPCAGARGGACRGTSQRAAAMDAAAQKKSPLGGDETTANGTSGAPVCQLMG